MTSPVILLAAAAATLLFAPTRSSAQVMGDDRPLGGVALGIVGGGTLPIREYKDVANTGWHLGAFLDFGRTAGPFGVRLEGLYHGFGDRDVVTSGGGTTSFTFSNKYSILNGNLNLTLGVPVANAPIRPYLIGGGGAYYLRNSPECASGSTCPIDDDESATKFGLNGGGGLEFGLAGFSAFVEARYHHVFTALPELDCLGQSGCGRTGAQLVPLSFGLTFRF
jgi:opacity protein-like surface antigen